jgi:anti-sigma B factor antagonist
LSAGPEERLRLIETVRHQDDVTIVDICGRFDAVSAPAVKADLHRLIEGGGSRLVVNLAKMDFVDSAGLGVLVSCLRRAAAEGGDLRLAEVPAFCRSIFELTRLTRVFDVTESEDQAVRALRSAAS